MLLYMFPQALLNYISVENLSKKIYYNLDFQYWFLYILAVVFPSFLTLQKMFCYCIY